jgi:bacterioferritin-associated ferredoxin
MLNPPDLPTFPTKHLVHLAPDNGIHYHLIHEVRARMYVCVCNAVTDREVGQAIDAGARTRTEVTRACGAGGDCGACHAMIEGMLEVRECTGERTAEPGLVAVTALVRERAA